jgi:phosphate transport system permease protein
MFSTIGGSGEAAIRGSVAETLRGRRRSDTRGRIFEISLLASLLICLLVLGALVLTVLTDGAPVYTDRGWEFLDGGISSIADRAGISQGIVGSFWIAVCVVVFAIPIGVGAAIYLEEYARRNKLTSFIELNIRNLAGVPSVVYGLLGLAIFVETFNGFTSASGVDRRTLAAAGVTLAVLVLPIVIITTQEAIRAVPQALREGAYGVGATRWEVIRSQVLPYAAPGIFTGSLLSIARAVGEAAPLIVVGVVTGYFSGAEGLNVQNVTDPSHLSEQFLALPSIVSTWAKEPEEEFHIANASATILAMLVFVLLINSIAIVLRNRYEKKRSS